MTGRSAGLHRKKRANDTRAVMLRLEVVVAACDSELIRVAVRMLDHAHALRQGASRRAESP